MDEASAARNQAALFGEDPPIEIHDPELVVDPVRDVISPAGMGAVVAGGELAVNLTLGPGRSPVPFDQENPEKRPTLPALRNLNARVTIARRNGARALGEPSSGRDVGARAGSLRDLEQIAHLAGLEAFDIPQRDHLALGGREAIAPSIRCSALLPISLCSGSSPQLGGYDVHMCGQRGSSAGRNRSGSTEGSPSGSG
jgi:hypothetical protein